MRHKIIFFVAFIFIATLGFAQSEGSPSCNVGDGICMFFNFGLPHTLDNFGAAIGVVSQDTIAADHADLLLEKELQQVDVLEKYSNDEIDDNAFSSLNQQLVKDQIVEQANIDDYASVGAIDQSTVDTLDAGQSDIIDSERQSGIGIQEEAVVQNGNGEFINVGSPEASSVQDAVTVDSSGAVVGDISSSGNSDNSGVSSAITESSSSGSSGESGNNGGGEGA